MVDREDLREECDVLDRIVESQLDQLDKLMRAQEEQVEELKREIDSLRGMHELRKRKQAELVKLDEQAVVYAARH